MFNEESSEVEGSGLSHFEVVDCCLFYALDTEFHFRAVIVSEQEVFYRIMPYEFELASVA